MSPTDRDRARARRRYTKREAVLAARAAERRRNRQVVVVVAAVVVVVAGFVGLSAALASKPSTTVALAAGCSTPPKVPGTAAKETLPPPSLAAGRPWIATLTTSCGMIEAELDGAKAPQTVASFVTLARSGFYANSPCHRLTTAGIFVLQCGDPTGTGGGGPGYGYGIENAPPTGSYPAGTLAMARTTDPKSNGSQFFLVYKDSTLPTSGGGYSIFGRVTKGLDIVQRVAAVGVSGGKSDGTPASPVSIIKVAVAEKKA